MKTLTLNQIHHVSGGLDTSQAGYLTSVTFSKIASFGIKALLQSTGVAARHMGVAGLAIDILLVSAFEIAGSALGYELHNYRVVSHAPQVKYISD